MRDRQSGFTLQKLQQNIPRLAAEMNAARGLPTGILIC
jgi:hypothetical protein